MADPFVAEIRIFGFNFAPTGWAFCDGQLLPISQNTALFALVGTYYGGDGKSTFALPNMQGSVPIDQGSSAGTSDYVIGQTGGSPFVTLITSEMPVHTHQMMASIENGSQGTLAPGVTLCSSVNGSIYQTNTSSNLVTMNPQTLSIAGGSLPHNNMMPYLTLNFCIALQGVFPARN